MYASMDVYVDRDDEIHLKKMEVPVLEEVPVGCVCVPQRDAVEACHLVCDEAPDRGGDTLLL